MKARTLFAWILLSIGILTVIANAAVQASDRIQADPQNPFYWQYHGITLMLLGGSQDDNLFQYPDLRPHLEEIAAAGGNYIRNTMSDRKDKGHEVYPFKQLENGKYDLNQWNEEYWKRFETMLKLTSELNIIVQIEVWDRFDYSRDNWTPHPYNPKNNINYTHAESGLKAEYPNHPGANEQPFFFTTPKQQNNQTLLPYQQRQVNKMLDISLPYPNVLYCIDNETSGEEAWANYWAAFIRNRAEKDNKPVNITQMWDAWDLRQEQHKRTLDHPERYDFADVSQNNHQRNETHWQNFLWVRNYIQDQPRPINSVKIYGADGSRHGGGNIDAVEKFWRLIFAGAASARFHRPTSGIGLSGLAQTQLRSARLLLEHFDLFSAQPDEHHALLSERDEDEAYLSYTPGKQYAVYFTDGGEVELDLSSAPGTFQLQWLEIGKSRWLERVMIEGGKTLQLKTPGKGMYVALIVKGS